MFLSGHTHIQTLQIQDGITYCNPGSVGQPRDHDPRAAYAILEDGEITLGRVAYDIDATAEQMRLADLRNTSIKIYILAVKLENIPGTPVQHKRYGRRNGVR